MSKHTNLSSNALLSNQTYNLLKWVATLLLPAAGALYFGLAQIWGLPNAEEVVGTLVVVDTFLGGLLGVSTRQYNNSEAKYDGTIDVTDAEDGLKTFVLHLDSDPYELEHKDDVSFKVIAN